MKRLKLLFRVFWLLADFHWTWTWKQREGSAQGWDLWTKFTLAQSRSSSLQELYLPTPCLERSCPGELVHTFCCVPLFCSFGTTFGIMEHEIFWSSVQRSKMNRCMPASHRKGWRWYHLPYVCVSSGQCLLCPAVSSAEAGGAVPQTMPWGSSHGTDAAWCGWQRHCQFLLGRHGPVGEGP